MGDFKSLLALLNAADYVIVIVIAFSTIISLWRGFVKEALSLANWFVAFTIAQIFNQSFSMLLQHQGVLVDSPYRPMVAYILLFFMSLLIGSLIVKLISATIKKSALAAADRFLGTAFGLLRGVLIVTLIVGVVRWLGAGMDTPVWQNSVMIPYFVELENWARTQLGGLISSVKAV